MTCKCSEWIPRRIGGEMRICNVEDAGRHWQARRRGAFGVAVQPDQNDRTAWEVILKWGAFPAEQVVGGLTSMGDAKRRADVVVEENCGKFGGLGRLRGRRQQSRK